MSPDDGPEPRRSGGPAPAQAPADDPKQEPQPAAGAPDAATPWRPVSALAVAVLIVVSALVVGAALGAVVPLGVPDAPAWRAVLSLLGFQATIIAAVLLAARRRGGSRAGVLLLRPVAGGTREIVRALAALLAVAGCFAAGVYLLDREALIRDLAPAAELLRSTAWPAALVAIGLGAPLAEELLFRGFLFSALAGSRLGIVGTTLVTNALWTALHAHYSPWGLAEVFLIGLILSWALVRTRSVLTPIAYHAIYNTALALALRLVPLPA
jgi:hypothetical protein